MRRNIKKAIRPSRLTLDQRIFVKAKGENEAKFHSGIKSELREFSFYNRTDLITQLAEHPKLPTKFMPVYGRNTKFHGAASLKGYISRENYPYWLMGMFRRNYELLKSFLSARRKINSYILKGDPVAALHSLAVVSEASESWWSIEMSIHINKELLGNDTKGYIKQLQDVHSNLNISAKTRDFLVLSESSNSQLYIDTVQGRLKEYNSSAVNGAAQRGETESLLLLPLSYDISRRPGFEALFDLRTWSIFDQYIMFQGIVMEMHSNGDISDNWLATIRQLAADVEDDELLSVIVPGESLDEFVASVLERYTCGDYAFVIAEISKAVLDESKSKSTYGLLEIYARSKIYTSTIENGNTYFDSLAREFAEILMLDSKSEDRADYLHKISIKFRNEVWAKSLIYHLALLRELRDEDDFIEKTRRQTLCLGRYNTPKARERHFQLRINEDNAHLIPEHRVLRYANDIDAEMQIRPSLFPIYSDYLRTKSRFYIEHDVMQKSLTFSINEYLKNNMAFDFLPIPKLAKAIGTLDRGADFDYVSSLIVLDIYGKECDQSFEELKTEIFEEYLDVSSGYKPSKLFDSQKIDSTLTYFLRNLCIPAQLDNNIKFDSNDEVIHERVAIIDLLISAKAANVEELRSEKDKVLETLFSEKLRAKIETGKLFVDVQALETHRRHVYVSLYEQAKSLEGGLDLEPLISDGGNFDSTDLVQIGAESSVPLAVASSEKSNILVRIFTQAVNDFALNENYGLDKYLSAEVRHIVFVTQLRSCFEKAQLVTSQRNGKYLQNDYWMQKYDYVPKGLIHELDAILAEFSQKVDAILLKVNDRFRIKVAELSAEHVFDFFSYHDRIVRVSEIIKQSSSFDGFFASLIGYMWELAVESARSAQQLINDVLLVDVLIAVDQLEADINLLKGNFAMLDLMQVLRDCRSDFKKEVELVLNWFRFVGSDDLQTFERLGVVVEAAVSSFQSMFKHKGVDLVFTQERTELMLKYSEARSLFISLFTALENALRYGATGTSVIISHEVSTDLDQLTISNDIGEEILEPIAFVENVKSKWTTEYSSLSTAEGGSGLYKIFNLLTNASKGFNFDVHVTNVKFAVFIGLKHEYFDNRRQPT
jgi:hypothetical protein